MYLIRASYDVAPAQKRPHGWGQSQLLRIQLTGTHAWWNAYNNNWYKDNTPLRDGKRNVVAGLYHITVPFVLSGYLCFRFQHTNHTKVVKIHKVISIVINSILWNHTNQLPPCHVIKLLRSFIVIIILWVIAMWKLTLAYLS